MKRLIFAPHGDDEIIGVGGTIAKYTKRGDEVVICNVTIGKSPVYTKEEAQATIMQLEAARKLLGIEKTIYLNFPAVMLDAIPGYQLNDALSKVIKNEKPDIVYIPHNGDVNKDHRLVAQAAMVALRPKTECEVSKIYAYETLSSTDWNIPTQENAFIPNVWEDISETLDIKLDAMSLIDTQLLIFPNARSIESMKYQAMYRGSIVGRNAAEAFMLIRNIVD